MTTHHQALLASTSHQHRCPAEYRFHAQRTPHVHTHNKHIHDANNRLFWINAFVSTVDASPLYRTLQQDRSDRAVRQVQGVHGLHRYQERPVSLAHPGRRQETLSPNVKVFPDIYYYWWTATDGTSHHHPHSYVSDIAHCLSVKKKADLKSGDKRETGEKNQWRYSETGCSVST